jgi:hypothetical protein
MYSEREGPTPFFAKMRSELGRVTLMVGANMIKNE